MTQINTLHGLVDEDLLIKRESATPTVTQGYRAISYETEYCLKSCPGQAHKTGEPDSLGLFCKLHIRRDVHVQVIEIADLSSALQAMG